MPEIYGTAYTEAARDLLKAVLDDLVADMIAAGTYNPVITYAYDRHNVADIDFNAVTVDLLEIEFQIGEQGAAGTGAQVQSFYKMTFTCRIHVDYIDGLHDPTGCAQMLNSVANKLSDNRELSTAYQIKEISDLSADEEFEESHTVGGQLSVVVWTGVNHTQE